MSRQGIEKQTQFVALIPIIILSILLEGYFYYSSSRDLDNGLHERAKLISQQLATSSEYAVFAGNRDLLQQQVEFARAQPDVIEVAVMDASGVILAGSSKSATFIEVKKKTEVTLLLDNRQAYGIFQPIFATQIALDDSIPSAISARKPLGAVVLVMGKVRLEAEKTKMLLLNLLMTLLAMAGSVFVAMQVARRITQPIFDLRSAVQKIGKGELGTRVEVMSVRELDELGQGINEMATQLERQNDYLNRRVEEATLELRGKKEEAEKANFDKTRFLAAASHDLRQPMHALGLFIGELQNRIDTPEQKKIVEKVEESVDALSGLLDSLLDISKLDAGVVIPQCHEIPIDILLSRMTDDFALLAHKKGVTLVVRGSDCYVMSDPVLLERILLNLLSNAIRYVRPRGTVMLACRRRGANLRIEVRDNGDGIPVEEQCNIFREFVQLGNVARDRSKGLGLGLAIVHRLCKLLDHPLSLKSAPMQGSTFAIEVPRVPNVRELLQADGGTSMTAWDVRNEFALLSVLVVDDDALVRKGTAGLLNSWGCEVEQASSFAEAKHALSTKQFGLIVCDYRLPDGNGLSLVDELSREETAHVALILISGDTSPALLQEVSARGISLLHKPVRPARLRSMMSFVLKR